MPFIKGGELHKILKLHKRFTEDVAKFYAAQICMAIGYLHSKNIMLRSLKLEDTLVDENGYLKVIDYGLAKILKEDQLSKTFCGTPEYLAPEMVKHEGHNFAVDWWALGILIYEMVIGVTPFYSRERKLLLAKIKTAKVVFPDKTKYKIDYSEDLVDIVQKLLNKDRTQRLGTNGDAAEILSHPWFASLNLEDIKSGVMEPPLKLDFSEKTG
jgi:serum/glucocorticoid-regulated kinase 2